MALYLIANGPMPTTAAQAVVTTGVAIKTLLQVKPATGVQLKIVEWGISFDGAAVAAPIKCELLETNVAATVTAAVAADLTKFDDPNAPAADVAAVALGTTSTGYTATSEGSITSVRMFDVQLVSPMGSYVKQFPLGREPRLNISLFGRIRVTAAAAVNAYCYMVIEV